MLGRLWYKLLNTLGEFPNSRNMVMVELFDNISGKGLDIGHDVNYFFKNNNVVTLNIIPGDFIDVVYDGKKIPFSNNTFDKILLRCVLEHVKDPSSILEEASRVLKLDGKMVIEVPFINPLHSIPDDYFRYTPDGLKELINDHNLKLEKVFYTEDTIWAIRWIFWQNLKGEQKLNFTYVIKMFVLKYLINPLFLKQKVPNENNFSQFGFLVKKQ